MRKTALLILLVPLFIGCLKVEIDDEKPFIDLTLSDAFPVSCDTLYFGESFTWTMLLTDNAELGSYSLEIHHNFDQHAHSTEVETCAKDPQKDPVNPFQTILDFEIPEGSTNYEVNEIISLPESDGEKAFDPGDYHFFISLTDREGWSMQKGLSIKILYRGDM